jgi:branched-chain amino acid aminotransferase
LTLTALQYTNINGKLISHTHAAVPANNRAFRYGHGLFETMLCVEGVLQLAEYHWQRLFDGMKQLYFDVPKLFTPVFLEAEVTKTITKNQLQKLCRVRLQVYPGNGGLYDAQNMHPQYVIECFPLEQSILQLNDTGLVLGIYGKAQKNSDALSNLKSCNALIYAVAAQYARAQKWNDALICNTAGNIIESTIANIFWVNDNQLYTPPLAEGCIAGVMRRHIMQSFEVRTTTFPIYTQ